MASTYVVGVTGGSGSGKTSFVKALKDRLAGAATFISQDEYYLPLASQPRDERGIANFDMPHSIDSEAMVADVRQLLAGHTVQRQQYTFETSYGRDEVERATPRPGLVLDFSPSSILVVEGLFAMHHRELHDLMDLRVFIQASEVAMLTRRIKRDQVERDLPLEDVLYRYEAHVLPAYRSYVEPYRANAHLVINNNHSFAAGLEVLATYLENKVA